MYIRRIDMRISFLLYVNAIPGKQKKKKKFCPVIISFTIHFLLDF